MSYNKYLIREILSQINLAIGNLKEWNADINCSDDYLSSPEGMKTLAASCMLLETIGECVKTVDRKTSGVLFALRPDIPWSDIIGMRNHIAHGYFDLDADIIFDVIQNHLDDLKSAIDFLAEVLEN